MMRFNFLINLKFHLSNTDHAIFAAKAFFKIFSIGLPKKVK